MSDSDSNDGLENMPPGYMPDDEFGMGGPEPQPEEHLWLASLSKTNNVIKFEGCDDAESNLILKRATLEASCEDESRHVIEIISLDHEDKRISGTLCSLSLKNNCSVSLDSLTISPPTAFKLIKGSGPITLTGNLMKEIDPTLLDEDEEDVEGLENGVEEGKIEEMEDDTSSEEETEEEASKENKKPANNNSGKRKNTENDSAENSKKQKTDNIKAKIETNKIKSEKVPIKNAKDLIEAIKASKGGRPSKRGKFDNWVKNQFKVDNKEWAEKAWKVLNEAK